MSPFTEKKFPLTLSCFMNQIRQRQLNQKRVILSCKNKFKPMHSKKIRKNTFLHRKILPSKL